MYATLLCLALAANPQQPDQNRTTDPNQNRNSTQGRSTDQNRSSSTGMHTNLDGTWTVFSLEKNGQPVTDARNMTVTVKDNTITCTGKDGKPMMTWKVDFANQGMLTVSETSADSGSGTNPGGTTGSTPGTGTGSSSRTGSSDRKNGVYVLTNDYLAVCLHDSGTGTGGTGASGTGTGGTSSTPGTGTGGTTSGSTTGTSTSSTGPQQKSYCSIILRREGSGSGTGSNPNR